MFLKDLVRGPNWTDHFCILGATIDSMAFSAVSVNGRVDSALIIVSAITQMEDPKIGRRLLRICNGFYRMHHDVS